MKDLKFLPIPAVDRLLTQSCFRALSLYQQNVTPKDRRYIWEHAQEQETGGLPKPFWFTTGSSSQTLNPNFENPVLNPILGKNKPLFKKISLVSLVSYIIIYTKQKICRLGSKLVLIFMTLSHFLFILEHEDGLLSKFLFYLKMIPRKCRMSQALTACCGMQIG